MSSPYSGKNRYPILRKAGRIIAKKIAGFDGVVGVLGTGAIGRRFGDACSDLDLIVYARQDAVRNLRKIVSIGWIAYKGIDYDIEVKSFEKAQKAGVPSKLWDQITRWDQQNSQILYDTGGRIKRLLETKLVYPDRERQALMKRYHQEVHEFLVFFPVMWAERGRLYNVIDALNRAVQSIIQWLYAKNRVFEPYIDKWLFFHLETKAIPEASHLDTLTDVYTRPIRNMRDAMKTRQRLLDLCGQIGLKWEVYSIEEAHERCRINWEKVSPETRDVLSW
ncbi:MAG: DUF4037 domain-containing protein [candidate division Zixibacteria bacterium]|nr:DUF4037 domain-containing protein [candidate division Zixibacteria bacterium]